MVAMVNHREDGDHQRQGIDRSLILANSKQVLIDEKVRFKNKITGRIYEDIALEYLSDSERNVPGWVIKPLLADYIAYAIAPIGKCYLLPVLQLQQAWESKKECWLQTYRTIKAKNFRGKQTWATLSCPVPPNTLFAAIGSCLRIDFNPYTEQAELEKDEPTQKVADCKVMYFSAKNQSSFFDELKPEAATPG